MNRSSTNWPHSLLSYSENSSNNIDFYRSFSYSALVRGGVAERSMAADCKSADVSLRRFESFSLHQKKAGVA